LNWIGCPLPARPTADKWRKALEPLAIEVPGVNPKPKGGKKEMEETPLSSGDFRSKGGYRRSRRGNGEGKQNFEDSHTTKNEKGGRKDI